MIPNNINHRYELKYVLSENTLNEAMNFIYIHSKAKKKFTPRTVNSIYFDNNYFSDAKDNLIGLALRKKFRLRWYNDGSDVRFEVKSKFNRLNSKEVTPINSLDNKINNLTIYDINQICQKKIFNGIITNSNNNEPALGVNYKREYFENQDGIRITIDKNIKFYRIFKNKKINDINFINYNSNILEVKFKPELIYKATNILKNLKIYSSRHSKYLTGLNLLNYINY